MSTFERWASKVEITETCWLWIGCKFKNGYGYFNNKKAHRVGFEFFKGPIPSGLVIDHICRVINCVNPNHLEAVTSHVNILRIPHRNACPHGGVKRRCKPCKAEVMRQLRASGRVA